MPSEKRSRGRITSGNLRPYKTARFGHEDEDDNDNFANGDSGSDISMEAQSYISAAPVYQSLDGSHALRSSAMRVTQMVAWPTSLGAIKNQVLYNLTPQDGYRLPDHVLQLVRNRILQVPQPDSMAAAHAPDLPYIHLGSASFLNTQIFVFLPNLRHVDIYDRHTGHVRDAILENWTDTVFLPSITRGPVIMAPRAPSSWRLANLYKRSPAWYDEEVAPFPVYRMHDSHGQVFGKVWESVRSLSMKVPEYQHPFLVLYANGDEGGAQFFYGSGPDKAMAAFEAEWQQSIDMAYLPCPDDNLKIDFEYGNALDVRNLPMR